MEKVVIIGNGIAGITAARHIRKASDAKILVISAESKYFFSRTALMYVYMGHMNFENTQPYEDWFWKKNKIQLIQDYVTELLPKKNCLHLKSGEIVSYDKLVLALGSKPNKLPIDGANLIGVQSLYSKQDLELMEINTQQVRSAAVVGGGLIGIEMAEMLHSRGIETHMVIRENSFWDIVLPKQESGIVSNHIRTQGIHLHTSQNLASINGTEKVESISVNNDTTIDCQFLGITIGVTPNIALTENTAIETEKGILVNENLQTSIENIYAIGDCVQLRNPAPYRKAIEPVWYTGRAMGEVVAANITGTPTHYDQGIWFNSAKFFNLEYQTYGYVPSVASDGFESLFWQDETTNRTIRIVHNNKKEFVGLNALGIRIRHEVCEKWIKQKVDIDQVAKNLDKLNFDPELYRKFERNVILAPV